MTVAEDRHARAFARHRSPRSDAYKAGHLAALRHHVDKQEQFCPYAVGSAESDAWHAGWSEGYDMACASGWGSI